MFTNMLMAFRKLLLNRGIPSFGLRLVAPAKVQLHSSTWENRFSLILADHVIWASSFTHVFLWAIQAIFNFHLWDIHNIRPHVFNWLMS